MNTVKPSAFAAISSRIGTTRAIAALRVGAFTAANDCCTPYSTRTTATESSPAAACNHSSAVVITMPRLLTAITVRRSTASAIAPPHSPNTISTPSPTAPVRPTYADEPVRS